jgi:hypothetical protein
MILEIEGAGTFRVVSASTIEHDIALTNLLRSSGAEKAVIDALTAGEEPDSRIFAAVTESGKLFDILAAALVPADVDPLAWTPAIAKETADKLKRVVSEQGKRVLLSSIVELVKAFFLVGLHSQMTSRNSTASGKDAGQPDGASAETTTAATGRSWFGSWLATIRDACRKYSGGR